MSETIAPKKTVTFTVTRRPQREAERKTIQRLMQMQPDVQKLLKSLQKRRDREDNHTYIRAGVPWNARVKATRVTQVEQGEQFTLRITPQIIPDLRSVEKYLEATPAS
jgi:hypothetical protein